MGPLFWHEMRVLARRKRYFALRLLALLAIVGLWWQDYRALIEEALRQAQFALAVQGTVYYGETRLPVSALRLSQTLARYGHHYWWDFVQVIGLLVSLLTPPLVIAAINEERQRGTMDLLMTSELSPLEVILGKTLPRVLFLGLIIVGALGVPMMSTLMGGLSGDWVLTTGIVILCVLPSLAAVAALLAALGLSTVVALVVCYSLAAGWMILGWYAGAEAEPGFWPWVNGLALARLLLTPVSLRTAPPTTAMAMVQAVVHVVVAVGLFWLAGKVLRRGNERSTTIRPLRWWRGRRPPLTGDEPLLWKERGPSAGWVWLTWLLVAAGVGTALVLRLAAIWNAKDIQVWRTALYREMEAWLPLVGAVAVLLPVVLVATRAAWSVRHEIDRATWETLLATPTSLPRILRAKWWGALLASLPALGAGAGMLTVTVLIGMVLVVEIKGASEFFFPQQLVGLGVGFVLMFGVAMFAASVGLFMSVVCQGAVWAVVSTYLTLTIFFSLPLALTMRPKAIFAHAFGHLVDALEILVLSGLPIMAVLTLALFSLRLRQALHHLWRLVGLPIMFCLSLQLALFLTIMLIAASILNTSPLNFSILSPVAYALSLAQTAASPYPFEQASWFSGFVALTYVALAYAVRLAVHFLALRRSERLGDWRRRVSQTVRDAEVTPTFSAPGKPAVPSLSS